MSTLKQPNAPRILWNTRCIARARFRCADGRFDRRGLIGGEESYRAVAPTEPPHRTATFGAETITRVREAYLPVRLRRYRLRNTRGGSPDRSVLARTSHTQPSAGPGSPTKAGQRENSTLGRPKSTRDIRSGITGETTPTFVSRASVSALSLPDQSLILPARNPSSTASLGRALARAPLGGGFPAPPFRLRGGFTVPP